MADKTASAPATHTQPSRKGKKAWRKNVDLSEVQQGLDTVRDETIHGGVLAERDADALFITDTTGDAEIQKQQRGKKLLRAEEIIARRSAVPCLDGKKRKAEVAFVGSGKKQRNGAYVSHKELQRLKMVADGAVAVDEEQARHDVWGGPSKPTIDPRLNFLDPPKPKREPKTLKHAPLPLTANGKALPNVRKPAAGKSYNPLVHDWSELFEREGAAAVAAEEARLAKEAVIEEREARAEAEGARVEAMEKEEYATDYESAWESEWDGFQSEGEEVHVAKVQKRKTPAERNKVKARKEREAREKWELKQKVRDAQERRIKEIAKEVSARDKLRQPADEVNWDNSEDSTDPDDSEALQRRRFGKLAIPEAPLEVTLPEDLTESLRRLKPEGNLLTDRYRNLLLNGKLEVRKKVGQVKKKQTQRFEKWTYKDWKLR